MRAPSRSKRRGHVDTEIVGDLPAGARQHSYTFRWQARLQCGVHQSGQQMPRVSGQRGVQGDSRQ